MKQYLSLFVFWLVVVMSLSVFTSCEKLGIGGSENSTSGHAESKPVSSAADGVCDHEDEDNNGYCDNCAVSVIVDFNLFAINDLHGKLSDSDSQPGVDEMTSYLMDAKENMDNTLIFSSGDMWQGTAESGLTYGKIITEWMNYLDFEFMTIGNHEFDWGYKYINENLMLSEFPFLAINIYDSDTNQLADFCDSSVMVDLGEIQIGFIGAIGDCYSSISAEMSEDYFFKTGNELTSLIKSESEDLRSQGADFIVLSLHSNDKGYSSTLSSGGYVDIVFEGHSHSTYVKKDAYGVYHLQGGGDNSSGLSYASVSYNFANGEYTVNMAKTVYHSEMASSQPDDIIDELLEKYSEQTSKINASLSNNSEYLGSEILKSIISELYAELAVSKWSNYDVVLGGGYISCRSPGYLGTGDVTYGDLYTLFPFNNRLALCSCLGQDLLNNYINNSNYYVTFTEYGHLVSRNIDPSAIYYIITDSYNYTYKKNNLTVVEYYDEAVFARDLFAARIKNGGLDDIKTPATPVDALIPDKYYTFAELTEYGRKLVDNADTGSNMFYSAGKITEISNTKYGNMTLVDNAGSSFMVYGLYSSDGTVRYDSMPDQPTVGDTILIYGKVKKYVNSAGVVFVEFVDARLIGTPSPDDSNTTATIPQLITLCMSLDAGVETQEKYCVVGRITEFANTKYGNCYIVDDNGNEFYIYGIYKDGVRYESLGNIQPQVGDTVTLYGTLKNYVDANGTVVFEMMRSELILK